MSSGGEKMTFSTKLKEEICQEEINSLEMRSELSAILRYDAHITNKITITFENGCVARRVFKDIKSIFNITPHIIVRNQKRLRAKQIYILELKNNMETILSRLNINKKSSRSDFDTPEEMVSFVRGAFLVTGSISDPSTSGYHLEFVLNTLEDANFLNKLLLEMKFDGKVLERNNKYMVYLKSAEEISDMIRMFKAFNTLFSFEDIRIYRDHKNMVNRLNNCEIANQEKTTLTGMRQLEDIAYLKEHDLMDLLDDKTKEIIRYRLKYPESSYQELSEIISLETDYKIGKSGINHHFIKMKKMVENHKKNES